MTYSQEDATQIWGQNVKAWREHFAENDPSRKDMLDPIILQLLGDVVDKRILDAGCGDGYLSRKLARLGAILTGVEISSEMLVFALEEQRKDPLAITYHLGDITRMSFLDSSLFDFVITNNVIQDTEDFMSAFKEFSRVLKPGGAYIHIENHPCFATPTFGWVRDEQGKRLYRKVDRYFKRGPSLAPWRPETGMKATVAWHRTLGDILNGLTSQGFRLQDVLEPEPPELWFRIYPDRADGDSRIPDFIVLYCVKEA